MTAQGLILIVEDDEDLRTMLLGFLSDEGYRVAGAGDGAEALAIAETCLPRVILLDMLMPGMSGTAFAEHYRTHFDPDRSTAFVGISASAEAEAWGREIGAAAMVPKPFDLSELLAVVASHSMGADG